MTSYSMKYLVVFLVLIGFTGIILPNVLASENIFYGTSSIERVPSSIVPENSHTLEIKFQYTDGPYSISDFKPVVDVNPKSAEPYVQIEFESLDGVMQDSIKRILGTITVDPEIPNEKIFLTISYAGTSMFNESISWKSGWNDSAIIDIVEKNSGITLDRTVYPVIPESKSPLKQFNSGISYNDIKCRDNRVLVLKQGMTFPACVRLESVSELFERNWALPEVPIIDTSTETQESKTIKITGVVNRFDTIEGLEYQFIPLDEEKPRIAYTGYDTLNLFATDKTVHKFIRDIDGDLVRIEGSLLLNDDGNYQRHFSGYPIIPVEKMEIVYENQDLNYTINGAQLVSITKVPDILVLNIVLEEVQGGSLKIVVPRELVDATIGNEDDMFFVLIDGIEVPYTEVSDTLTRTLTIPFEKGARVIEIIATVPI